MWTRRVSRRTAAIDDAMNISRSPTPTTSGGVQGVAVAARADVVEPLRLPEDDPGGVVAAVLEALEPLQEERLRLTRSDVSDDPAHSKLLSSLVAAENPPEARKPGLRGRS